MRTTANEMNKMIGNSEIRNPFLPATLGQTALAPMENCRGLRIVEGYEDDIPVEDYRGMGVVVDAEGNVIPPQSEVGRPKRRAYSEVLESDDEFDFGSLDSDDFMASGSTASVISGKAGRRPAEANRPAVSKVAAMNGHAVNRPSVAIKPAVSSTPVVHKQAGNKSVSSTPAVFKQAGDMAVSASKPMASTSSVINKQADNQTLTVSKTSNSYSPRANLNNYSPTTNNDARQNHVTAIDNRKVVSNSNNTNHIHVQQASASRLTRFLIATGILAIIGLLTFNAVMLYRNNHIPVATVTEASGGEISAPLPVPVSDDDGEVLPEPVPEPEPELITNPEPAEINVSRIVDASEIRQDCLWDNRGHDYNYGLFAQTRNEYAILNAEGMYKTMTGTICSNLNRGSAGVMKIYNGDTLSTLRLP